MHLYGPPCRRSAVCMIAVSLLAVPLLCHAQTFPDKPFNGLQVSYTISGATLSAPSDGGPMEGCVRTYSGTLGTGTLRVSGSFNKSGIKGGGAYAVVSAGGKSDSKSFDLSTPAIATKSQTFDVSLPITDEVTSASINVTMGCEYGNGESRFVRVQGTFTRQAKPKPNPAPTPPPTPPTQAAPRDGGTFGSGYSFTRASGDVLAGKVWLSDADTKTPLRVEPGSTATIYPGACIETGPGARMRLRYPDGATCLIKPNSKVTITPQGFKLQVGEAVFDIWKLGREFQVNVPDCGYVIGVLGTVFAVKVSPDGLYTTLAVKESKAWIADPRKNKMTVPAGYYSVNKRGGRPSKPARMTAKQMAMYFGELSLLRASAVAGPRPAPATVAMPNLTGEWSVMHNTYPGTLRLQQSGTRLTGTMYASKLLGGEVCADGTVKWTRDDCQQKWVGRYSKDAQGRDVLSGVFWCPVAKNWNTKWTATRIR